MGSKWIHTTIGALGEVVGGATPSTKNPKYWGGDVPWVSPRDLTGYHYRYISSGERNITEDGLQSCSTRMLPPGTILFSSRAPIGYVAIAENSICTNQGFKSVIPNESTDSLFLYYLLKHNASRIEGLGSGTTFKEVSGRTMSEVEVDVPDSIEDQRKIAGILGAIDDKIELNQRINDYLATLVDLEFSKRFSGSVSTTSLKNVLEISTKSLKPQQHAGETWEHYSIPAFDEMHWPIFELADGIKSNKYIVDRSSILISKLNPSIKRMWIPACLTDKAVCSTEFIVYKPLEPRHKSFYCAAINADSFTAFLLEHVTGSTGSRQRAQPKATLDYPMPSPCRTAIEAFCDFADPIYRQIELNEIESQRLGSLRDALLPKLMSGEIDVSKVGLTQPNNHLYAD